MVDRNEWNTVYPFMGFDRSDGDHFRDKLGIICTPVGMVPLHSECVRPMDGVLSSDNIAYVDLYENHSILPHAELAISDSGIWRQSFKFDYKSGIGVSGQNDWIEIADSICYEINLFKCGYNLGGSLHIDEFLFGGNTKLATHPRRESNRFQFDKFIERLKKEAVV